MKFFRIRDKETGKWATRGSFSLTDSEAYAATFDSIKNLRLHLFSQAKQIKYWKSHNLDYAIRITKFYDNAEIVECEVKFVESDQSHLDIVRNAIV